MRRVMEVKFTGKIAFTVKRKVIFWKNGLPDVTERTSWHGMTEPIFGMTIAAKMGGLEPQSLNEAMRSSDWVC